MTVLIADDDAAMRSVLQQALRVCGLQVVGQARDGKEAVESFRKLQPQIVCLDLEMPNMNGLEALNAIRQESEQVIVLIITGAATSAVVQSAIASRVNGIIAKPFSVDQIRGKLLRCVEHASAARVAKP